MVLDGGGVCGQQIRLTHVEMTVNINGRYKGISAHERIQF